MCLLVICIFAFVKPICSSVLLSPPPMWLICLLLNCTFLYIFLNTNPSYMLWVFFSRLVFSFFSNGVFKKQEFKILMESNLSKFPLMPCFFSLRNLCLTQCCRVFLLLKLSIHENQHIFPFISLMCSSKSFIILELL